MAKHRKRRRDVRPFMPMLTVYTGDPSLRMRCNETRTFALTPDPTMTWNNARAYKENMVGTYRRLEFYGLRGGYHLFGMMRIESAHYMTECKNHVAYFKNSV